jgi:hypothetical protein
MRHLSAIIALLALPVCGQHASPSLFGSRAPIDLLTYYGPGAGAIHGSASRIAVEGSGFTEAIRMRTAALPADAGESDQGVARLHSTGQLALAKGDIIPAEFSIRRAESTTGDCATRLSLQNGGPGVEHITGRSVLAKREWRRHRFHLTAATDAAGKVQPRGFLGNYELTVTPKDGAGGGVSGFQLSPAGVNPPVRLGSVNTGK